MNYIYRLFAVLLVFLSIAACASLSKNECSTGDWYAIGFDDGKDGKLAGAQFDRHIEACGKHGIAPDSAKYDLGHEAGVRDFCGVTGAVALARKNLNRHPSTLAKTSSHEYKGICPKDLEPRFLRVYVENLRDRISQLNLELGKAEQEVRFMERDLAVLKTKDGVTKKQLEKEESSIKSKYGEISKIREDIAYSEAYIVNWK